MIRPATETEDPLLSFTKNSETLIDQTHTRRKEILEFKFIQPKEIFTYKPSIILGVDSKCMIRLPKLKI